MGEFGVTLKDIGEGARKSIEDSLGPKKEKLTTRQQLKALAAIVPGVSINLPDKSKYAMSSSLLQQQQAVARQKTEGIDQTYQRQNQEDAQKSQQQRESQRQMSPGTSRITGPGTQRKS